MLSKVVVLVFVSLLALGLAGCEALSNCDSGYFPATNNSSICCRAGYLYAADDGLCYRSKEDVPGPDGLSPNEELMIDEASDEAAQACFDFGYSREEQEDLASGIMTDWLIGISLRDEVLSARELCQDDLCETVECFSDCTSCHDKLITSVYGALEAASD